MGDHLYTPPLVADHLAGAFDLGWLALDRTAPPPPASALAVSTRASDQMAARAAAYWGTPLPPPSAAGGGDLPHDDLVGVGWRHHVERRAIAPALAACRNYFDRLGVAATTPANALRGAIRRRAAGGSGGGARARAPPLPASHPTDATDATLTALLASVPTLTALQAELDAVMHTAALMRSRRAIAHYQNRNVLGRDSGGSGSGGGSGGRVIAFADMCDGAPPTALLPPQPDVLLRVALYAARDRGLKSQEFLALGTNTLADLRDCIYCPAAAVGSASSSAAAAAAAPAAAAARAFFAIEGVLYDDMRATPAAHAPAAAAAAPAALLELLLDDIEGAPASAPAPAPRLSAAVVAWNRAAVRSGVDTGWGVLQSGDACSATLGRLPLRLGAHYLYCHEVAPTRTTGGVGGGGGGGGGGAMPPGAPAAVCEHLVVFTDARLASATVDAPAARRAAHPRQVYQARTTKARCAACGGRRYATAAVYGDRHAPGGANPAYLCTPCFDALHRAADGTLLYTDFDVVPYLHD